MKDTSLHYSGESGKHYAELFLEEPHSGYRMQSRFYKPWLSKDMRVLDFGCNKGVLTSIFSEYVGSIEGLEVNPYSREGACERGLKVYASLDELPPEPCFDAIVSNHVIEHVPNVIDTLNRLRRRLKPGGRIILMTPIEDIRQRHNQRWNPDDVHRHLYGWTPLLMGNTLLETGFHPVHFEVITHQFTRKLLFLGDNPVHELCCRLFAWALNRRQLLGVAERRGPE